MMYSYARPRPEMSAIQLSAEIKTSLGYETKIQISSSEVNIQFTVELTDGEKATLDKLVETHYATPPPPGPLDILLEALDQYGVHSYTPAQIDAFIDSVDNVPDLRALLKTMAKCIVAFADYFQS